MTMTSNFRSLAIRRQPGLALVIVLWILTLLTLMAGSFAMTMRRESSVSYAITSSAKALALSESGIVMAEYKLVQTDPEQRLLANGTIYEIIGPESNTRIRIFSENGKVDINASSSMQLEAILRPVINDDWQRQSLLNAILDWRDADDDTRTLGAEKRQYKRAGLSYEPTNTAFQSLEELQLVLGMNESIFNAIQPFITVYSGEASVNQKEASPELLEILAADLDQRNIVDAGLQNRLNADDAQDEELDDTESDFASENQTYTIIAESIVQGEASASLEAVVQYQGNENGSPFETLDWKQNPQTSSLFNPAMEIQVITLQDEFRFDDRF